MVGVVLVLLSRLCDGWGVHLGHLVRANHAEHDCLDEPGRMLCSIYGCPPRFSDDISRSGLPHSIKGCRYRKSGLPSCILSRTDHGIGHKRSGKFSLKGLPIACSHIVRDNV